MRNLHGLTRSIKEGVKNIGKNRSFTFASIGTLTACLFMFGVVYFLLANLRYNVDELQTNFGVSVFFEEEISQSKIDQIGEKIKQREEVYSISLITPEEAWDSFSKEYPEELVESFKNDNPLANLTSYFVALKKVENQKQLASYIESLEGVRHVRQLNKEADLFQNMNSILKYGSIGIIGLLLIISIFLISITISAGITVRQEEICIMKLIGASDIFVKGPFYVEGMLIGLIGSVLPFTILHFVFEKLMSYITTEYSVLPIQFLSLQEVYQVLVPVIAAVGIGIGLLGSIMTVRKHLRR